jgi:hypothetical protein
MSAACAVGRDTFIGKSLGWRELEPVLKFCRLMSAAEFIRITED